MLLFNFDSFVSVEKRNAHAKKKEARWRVRRGSALGYDNPQPGARARAAHRSQHTARRYPHEGYRGLPMVRGTTLTHTHTEHTQTTQNTHTQFRDLSWKSRVSPGSPQSVEFCEDTRKFP